ncbi:MAG: hypothetical protein QM478_04500 [Flavobacteriaceae bacterium]
MKQLLVLLLALITLFSCKQNTKVVRPTKTEHSKETHSSVSSVKLNDGEKWMANIETTEGIQKMQFIMNSFSDKESINEYKLLKEKLEVEFTNIFTLCTMKGESHNQLHNYLKPLIGIFEGLESGELKTCKENFSILNNHLAEYTNYFE